MMPQVHFTPHLQLHVECQKMSVDGSTLRETLDSVFAHNETLKGYLLDDQLRLRKHVVIFIDDKVLTDRDNLSDPVQPESEIYIMQALSGG